MARPEREGRVRNMAAKKTARPRKKTVRSKSGRRKKAPAKTAYQRFEAELPADLRSYSKRVAKGLTRLERQIESARKDARRNWTRLLRDVSHQLGSIEAAGEKRWRKRTLKARRDAVKLLHRLEKAIEPPKKKAAAKKKPTRAKAAARKKPARAKAAARPRSEPKDLPVVTVEEPVIATPPMPPPPL